MKTSHKLALAMLASFSIGAAGGRAIPTQQVKTPSAFIISEADAVTDQTDMKEYGEKVPETLEPFQGHFHFVVGGKPKSLYGVAPEGIVVIAFDSAEQARAWYDSPAYKAIRPIRETAVKGRMFILEGEPPK
jgi:uncharacterized protein (DUF1330 family)